MKRRLLLALGIIFVIVGVLCFLLGSFIRIIHCDYPGCEEERTQSVLLWYGGGAASALLGGVALFRASRTND